MSADPAQWLVIDNGKVSKKHAVIFFDEMIQEFKLRCYGRNGVDCNGEGKVKEIIRETQNARVLARELL